MRAKASEEYGQKLELYKKVFRLTVENLANEVRAELLPEFKKRGWTYIAGNGTWFVTDRHGKHIHDWDLPKPIFALLYLEVTHHEHIGHYIRDITEEYLP